MDGTRRTKAVLATPHGDSAGAVASDPEWLTCLRETCDLLWPLPATTTLEIGKSGWPGIPWAHGRWALDPALPAAGEFVLVPWFRRPPLLVPAGRRAAAAAVSHYSRRSAAARLGINALSLALGGGLSNGVLRGRVRVNGGRGLETIEGYLKTLMSRDIYVSMYLGPARANRKPVLQLLTGTGETVGFAKVGVNPLTSRLVRAERDALTQLAGAPLAEITIPRVLHYGVWHGLDILVLSALPAWRRHRPLSAARLACAMGELARVDGLRCDPLNGSDYLRHLRSSLRTADEGAEQVALIRALDALAAGADGTMLAFGAWHGDWAPWNMANTGLGMMVWDWERFTPGVPYGFDVLHYWLQSELRIRHRDPRAAAAGCVAQAPQLLSAFGIDPRPARVTAILYLSELATRYLADRQAQAGAPLGAPGTWLIPAITAALTGL